MSATATANGEPSTNASRLPLEPFVNGQPEPQATEGRDAGGRFVKGWKGGPGNPYARKVAALRSALIKAIDADKMEKLADSLYRQALAGDVAAATLLLRYCVGVPREAPDPDCLDADEWKKLRDGGPGVGEFCITHVDTVPAELAVDLVKQLRERAPPDPGRHVGGSEIWAEQAARRKRRK
jgi:hypothetical protein